ncbi:MAG: hypothetical protein IJN19_02360 [Opitutales bacterium]|nr:hypothetical protein [Opitutales bacterium]
MSFLRNIALALAFVLMLIGNTAALDICFTGGELSLAGSQPCECVNILHCDNQECGETHPPETPHEHMTVELDDDLASGKTTTNAPAPTFVFLCAFFESFSEIRLLSVIKETPPPPPDSRQILLRSPVATGTRPLLA